MTNHHGRNTPLELFFDLTFVIAFGVAGSQFAHEIAEAHLVPGLLGFGFAMFAVIWAWINFTWFASAYDTDDWVFRVVTMVQIVGVLILTMGIEPMFHSIVEGHHVDNRVIVAGYVLMRLALVAQWIRASRQDPARRETCLRYARYLAMVQLGWVAVLVLETDVPTTRLTWLYSVMMGADRTVIAVAAGILVVLAGSVGLAALGASVPVCMLVMVLALAASIVIDERRGSERLHTALRKRKRPHTRPSRPQAFHTQGCFGSRSGSKEARACCRVPGGRPSDTRSRFRTSCTDTPVSARSANVTAPSRFASRAPSSLTTSGTCAYSGSGMSKSDAR